MHLDITKLDGRFTGYPYFHYRIRARYNAQYPTEMERCMAFNQMRNWLIEQFGMSCERDIYLKLIQYQPVAPNVVADVGWCWHPESYRPSFYVSEPVMNWINLKTVDQTISIVSGSTP
jgi:hypothetical protein